MPNGPSRNEPPARSSSEPKTLGESKRGTQSQSIAPSGATKAPVWQFERNAYSAIGGNGDGAAALGADDATGFPSVLAFVATELMRAFRQGPLRRESLGSQRGGGIIRCEGNRRCCTYSNPIKGRARSRASSTEPSSAWHWSS